MKSFLTALLGALEGQMGWVVWQAGAVEVQAMLQSHVLSFWTAFCLQCAFYFLIRQCLEPFVLKGEG